MTTITMYVCPIVNYWRDFEARTPFGQMLPLHMESEAGAGFLTVYEDLDTYRRAHPDIKPFVMAVKRAEGADDAQTE